VLFGTVPSGSRDGRRRDQSIFPQPVWLIAGCRVCDRTIHLSKGVVNGLVPYNHRPLSGHLRFRPHSWRYAWSSYNVCRIK
jgi:hypothetical protein